MPLYEYQCKKCHSLTERIQKFSDPPMTVCPHCGGEVEQVLSAPAVQFKGSGWYVTDYSRKSGAPASGSSGNGSSGSSSAENKSSESKPEGKKDSGESSSASGKDQPASKS